MSSRSETGEHTSRSSPGPTSIAEIAFPVSEKEVETEAFRRRNRMDGSRRELPDDEDGPRDRGDYWYDSIGERVNENEQRGVENRIYLEKIDVKVTWIVRILAAIITAGAVRYSVMVFGV